MGTTSIEWCDAVWNPTTGCTRISAGCKNCYAFALHDKRHKAYQDGKNVPEQYAKPFTELQMMEDRLTDPLHWKKPRRVFVNSVSDLFHEDVPDEFLDKVFAVMAMTAHCTFQILTKRPERMRDYLRMVEEEKDMNRWACVASDLANSPCAAGIFDELEWPLPNVWLGTSVEDQKRADERIPILINTPAKIRFLSCEPLLEEVKLSKFIKRRGHPVAGCTWKTEWEPLKLHWVIVGGESGPNSRPFHVNWARSLIEQCKSSGTACFVKQMGENVFNTVQEGKEKEWLKLPKWPEDTHFGINGIVHLKDRKGSNPEEWPSDLQVREYPET